MDDRTEIMKKEEPKKEEKVNIGHTTIIRNRNDDVQKTNIKKMFKRDELRSFTERVNYDDLEKKKVTDDKTDIEIDIEDYYKDEDDIHVGCIIDDKYELFELITKKSGEAAIYKCHIKGFSGVFVAKVYYPNIQPKQDIIQSLINLNSENVVKLNMVGNILSKNGLRFYEIMPYYSKGNLEMRMPLSEAEISEKIVPAINEGLRAIHRLNIIHRDLKPNNLFIEETGPFIEKKPGYKLANNERIIIGDFGISSQIKDGQTHRVTSASRTRGYGAPETIRDNVTTSKSDYFSFGITLLTLLVGEYPYHDEVEMILKIKDGIFDFPDNVSERMRTLIMGLMNYDRNDRYGYDEVNLWLENKTIEKPNVKTRPFDNVEISTPYEFKFKKYYRLVDLVEAMTQDWKFAIQHIENRFIDKYFRGVSKEFDEILANMDRLRHTGGDSGKIFLTLIYSVLQYDGIVYEDLNFSSISDMSDYILSNKEVDRRIIRMVKNKSLFYILTLINKHSHPVGDMVKLNDILNRVRTMIDNNAVIGYYLLGFVFNKDKLNMDIVKKGIINGYNPVYDIKTLYESFSKAPDKDSYADALMSNNKFKAWLFYKNYDKNIDFLK